MQKRGAVWMYSPSDLIQFLENEALTWFERFDKERPGVLLRDDESASDRLVQQAGEEHEKRFLDQLRVEHRDLVNLQGVEDAGLKTLEAMRSGREVIYQARLEVGEFAGYADFLFRVEGNSDLGAYHYEVWDTKLARGLKPYFAIQLCCYAELLEGLQGKRPEFVGIVLGSGVQERLRTNDFFFYYKAIKRTFLEQQRAFNPDQAPRLFGTANYGHWTGHVTRLLEAHDDLSFVANVRATQIEKLDAAGIKTLAALASGEGEVASIQAGTLNRLRMQAKLQLASRSKANPLFELIAHDPERPRLGFGALPPESKNDLCFDMEGYPLVEGGLEYLFGVIIREGARIIFRDWWAHDREQERGSFEQFTLWAHARWCEDPQMHIYHYASYEVSALKRLMCRYGCCEAEVDDLLRNGVFVDLYSVVRQALIIGEPFYSLKNVERLYMPERTGEVSTAEDSIVQYHRWLEFRDGEDWPTSTILQELRNYNEQDCRSTWSLVEWLRNVQSGSGVPYLAPAGEPKKPGDVTTGRAALAQEMLAEVPVERGDDTEKWRVHELLAHLLEFHRREHKPSWWFLFERSGMTEQELIEDPDSLGGLERTRKAPELTATKRSLRYEFQFDPGQESKLRDGDKCRYAHDIDCKVEIEKIDYEAGLLSVTFAKSRPAPPTRLSLIPDDIFNAGSIVDSIERTARAYRTTHNLPCALADFLLRRAPRITGREGGSLLSPGMDALESSRDVVERMNGTTLFIQGPPGCGKTYTGGELIARLLGFGKRVGVTSNSHRAICLLLKSAADAADRLGVKFKGVKAGCDESQEAIHPSIDLLAENGDVFKLPVLPNLVGGTAWVFSKAEASAKFDYLFVDEAGQVSLANLVGMAPAAQNIVLLGDQMQLNQPMQGVHPGESGKSVLEYLLEGAPTVAEDRGILLPDTWRMRPEVCDFISDGIYEGRIQPHPITSERRIRFGEGVRRWINRESGLLFIPVSHE
jgi:predicted RecB family nuclease